MLLLTDGVRFCEPARDVAIEFVFTMDRQVIAIASWVGRRTSGFPEWSRLGRFIRGFHRLPRLFFWSGTFCNLRSEIRNSLTSGF